MSFGCFGRERRVLGRHVPREIAEGAVAARAHAMADTVLQLGHLAARCGNPTLCCLSSFSLLPNPVIFFGEALAKPVSFPPEPVSFGFGKMPAVAIGTMEIDARVFPGLIHKLLWSRVLDAAFRAAPEFVLIVR
jgi:hypothetical protein